MREGDPAAGVAGPDYDPADAKQLQWLYPRELLALAACSEVPLVTRRRIVLATYLCLRGGELKALTWDKIDLERGVVIVDEAYDRERDTTKSIKTGNRGSRRYTIEPTLMPLLRAMHAEADGSRAVIEMGLQKLWAAELRRALEFAEVKRPELFRTTDASKRVRFHDLRASGLTWMAIRGDSPVHVKHVAGHTAFEMTQKYIAAAGAVELLPGEVVFPPLPAGLFEPVPPKGGNGSHKIRHKGAKSTRSLWRRRELKTGAGSTSEPTFRDFYGGGWKRGVVAPCRSASHFVAATQGAP